MPFLGALPGLVPGPDGTTFTLTADLAYLGRDQGVTVPAGFVTDLASVPRIVQWLIPRAGLYDWAAVVHDYLCWRIETGRPVLGPVDTDGLFRRIMRELGVPVVTRWLMWAGVRVGAALTPARRPGWWSTAPAVAALALPALVFLLIPTLVGAVALALIWLGNTAGQIAAHRADPSVGRHSTKEPRA